MAVSDIEAVLEFLRKNGLSESESALMEDILEISHLGSYDFERFVFPMVPPPPPLRIPSTRQLTLVTSGRRGDEGVDSFSDSSDEFVSLGSSSADLYPSDFTNPYGIHTATGSSSHASSDRLSQFGTARDYHDFDMQNDLLWYRENDHDYVMPPCFDGPDSFGGPSEDKFVMTIETENQNDDLMGISHITEQFRLAEKTNSVNKPWPSNFTSMDHVKDDVEVRDYYNTDQNIEADVEDDKEDCAMYSCSAPLYGFCAEGRELYAGDPADCSLSNVKNNDLNGFCYRASEKDSIKCNPVFEHKNIMCSINSISAHDWVENLEIVSGQTEVVKKESNLAGTNDCEPGHKKQLNGDLHLQDAATEEEGGDSSNELLIYDTNEDEYEVFNLRIFHRKNRTGFEEHKDLPIVLSSIIAGRYYVTEYLGSAAFSKVIQAYDLQTRMDVCLKIIKNDKDFFDQSLDEIKLLKFVNKHDPGDDCHILRLYDYLYYQEHLIIVCELLRANLYEFQKYNRESGGEPYFTLSRLQVITRQCLEALEYLHALGIIHCDLKPENILMKSYRRCEIKVIDLGSSCFQADNLCLYVQSRSYRAPEVIIGLPYDHKIDLWSLGCILAELCSGVVLFPNEAIVSILARMIGMLGPIDMEMLTGGQETHKYFTNEYDLYHINEETNQLEYIIPDESSLENHLQVSDIGFIEFVRSLLEINPNRRLSATEALQHPWLCYSY